MPRTRKGQKITGWINLDKPVGLTSTQALGRVRRLMDAQKAGHAGTLDPLASGILPIALGEATKFISYIQDGLKAYDFTVKWGEQRSTDDSEGDIIATSPNRPIADQIRAALPRYTGHISQMPPKFSALKIDGQRAYDLARNGQEFEVKPREVFVESLAISPPSPPACGGVKNPEPHPFTEGKGGESFLQEITNFTMTCGKGTYVRAIARDLGRDLGCYGHITALRRTRVGAFGLDTAISLDKLEEIANSGRLDEALLPLQTPLDDIPALAIRPEEAARLRNGQVLSFISRPDFARLSHIGPGEDALAICENRAVALIVIEGPEVRAVRVINNA